MIYKKLLAIQGEVVAVSKDWSNPHFKSEYMKLDTIIEVFSPILTKHQVVLTHRTKDSTLITTLYDTEDDTSIESEFAILNTDPQKRGAEISYGRRYNLQQLLNIRADDDDGNSSSGESFQEKPWFNQPQLEWLSKVIWKYSSYESVIKEAKWKYRMSKTAEQAIYTLYNTWTITKI